MVVLVSNIPFGRRSAIHRGIIAHSRGEHPRRSASIKKSTHPWLTERGEEAVRRKHAAQGTGQETEAARECNDILLEEHYDFVAKMRSKLLESKPSSKSWCSKARRLTDRKQRVSNITALNRGTEWILEAEEKQTVSRVLSKQQSQ